MHAKTWLFILFFIGALAALIVPLVTIPSPAKALGIGLLFVLGYLLAAEILFRVVYGLRCGQMPERFKRIPFDQLHVEPHPYMPYAYKRDFKPRGGLRNSDEADYPLHKGRFQFARPSFNNYRLHNGPDGQRDIAVPKPEGVYRIVCLGGSTTGNYIMENGALYSYPSELEKELNRRLPDAGVEVVNGGVGGRTSAELLIHFLLSLIDTEPDAIVLYHAYNDIGPSLTPGFQSDYSHARKNLGESYTLYRLRAMFPDLPSALYTYVLNSLFPGNLSNSLLTAVTAEEPDMAGKFQGLSTYKRNLKHVIDICKARGIKVFCATYCQHLYPEIEDSPMHLKCRDGLALENGALKELAEEEDLTFIDTAAAMPADIDYYVDSVHLTPLGMQTLAKNLANGIIPEL